MLRCSIFMPRYWNALMPSNQLEAILTCGCCSGVICVCDGRCNPLTAVDGLDVPTTSCTNPLPVTLTVDIASTSTPAGSCFNGSGTITFKTPLTGGTNCWTGTITGSCTDCNSSARTWSLTVTMCCVSSTLNEYQVVIEAAIPAVIDPAEQAVIVSATTCDPFLLEGCIPGDINGFVIACIATMPPTQQVFSDVCFQIYETP